jgi:hypothetical protein
MAQSEIIRDATDGSIANNVTANPAAFGQKQDKKQDRKQKISFVAVLWTSGPMGNFAAWRFSSRAQCRARRGGRHPPIR